MLCYRACVQAGLITLGEHILQCFLPCHGRFPPETDHHLHSRGYDGSHEDLRLGSNGGKTVAP